MPSKEEIVAMAVACVAEELGTDVSRVRVVSFARVHRSGLEKYVNEHEVDYHKYQLGDEAR